MKKYILMLVAALMATLYVNAKSEDLPLFPRTFGYNSKGDAATKTITYEKDYARYGMKNKGTIDFTAYTNIVLEIEPTDSRIELGIIYDNDGEEEKVILGKVPMGKTSLNVEFDGLRKIKAIFLTKSKPGKCVVKKFCVTDGQD